LCMSMSRRVARPLLASMFLVGGVDAVRNPEGKVKKADPVAQAIASRVTVLPQETETLVRINGAVMVGAGALLAIGKWPRLAALALIGTILPTTYAGHRFWEETDEATKAQQRIHFIKNLGLLGGLILAAVDTEGAPSLGWRARRRARRAGYALKAGQSRALGHAHGQAHQALAQAGDLLTLVSGSGAQAVKQAQQTAGALSTSGSKAAARAQQSARQARKSARQARSSAGRNLKSQKAVLVEAPKAAAQRGRAAAEPVLSTGMQKAGELWGNVAGHVHDLVPAG
jgi:putative oxidoreductase